MFKTRVLTALAAAMIGLVAAATGASGAEATTEQTPDGMVRVGDVLVAESLDIDTDDELDAYIESDAEKAILIDAPTGEIISVAPAEEEALITPLTTVTQNNCSSGRACLYGWYSPSAFYGFSGSGTVNGN